ncbi:hypothetical protein Tco_1512033, partial [Tanacetum coccineum]
KTYFFTLDDQIFEVNSELICEALQINPKVFDHPFVEPLPENEIMHFIKKLGYFEYLTKISDLAINNMYQLWRTFMTMINKYLTGKASANKSQKEGVATFSKIHKAHNQTYPLPEQPHIQETPILPPCHKIDATLRNLKFTNKGAKDPVFGMAIPMVMLSEEIKAYEDYLNYLAKSTRTQPVKVKGKVKGLLTKKGVEVVMEMVRIPKKRRSETVIEETGQSEEVADTVDSKETGDDEEEPQLTRRKEMTKLQARKVSKDDFILKQRPKGPGKGFGVAPEVPDRPSGSSSSSCSESDNEIEDISSDDERSEAGDMEKIEKADDDKVNDDKVKEVKVAKEQIRDNQAENSVLEPQVEKPVVPLISSSLTLSSTEYGNQFINDNPDVSMNDVLKDPAEIEIQS